MKIAILKERRPHETRVAATPETVKKLKALGAEEIVIESGAGVAAAYTDAAYAEAGATIVPDAAAAVAASDVVFVSSNRWDIAGAAAFGFTPVWVNRLGLPDEYGELAPRAVIASLGGLV